MAMISVSLPRTVTHVTLAQKFVRISTNHPPGELSRAKALLVAGPAYGFAGIRLTPQTVFCIMLTRSRANEQLCHYQ